MQSGSKSALPKIHGLPHDTIAENTSKAVLLTKITIFTWKSMSLPSCSRPLNHKVLKCKTLNVKILVAKIGFVEVVENKHHVGLTSKTHHF